MALLLLPGCGDGDGGRPPSTESTTPSTVAAVTPSGFELADVTLTGTDGAERSLTVWVADSPDERARGLMGVTDLGEGDAMLFVFEQAAAHRFYMWQTPLALDLAFFDADGAFVSSATMRPCLEDTSDGCERYPAAGPALSALELPAGQLARIGVGPGSMLEVTPRDAPVAPGVPRGPLLEGAAAAAAALRSLNRSTLVDRGEVVRRWRRLFRARRRRRTLPHPDGIANDFCGVRRRAPEHPPTPSSAPAPDPTRSS